ncbi:MAG: PAS domain-containing protein [Patescibacteria group bacterium]|nr:PAS domain-containing protein [Patescibacteria group bacterium]
MNLSNQKLLEIFLSNSHNPILITDLDFSIIDLSASAESFFKQQKGMLLHTKFVDKLSNDSRNKILAIKNELINNKIKKELFLDIEIKDTLKCNVSLIYKEIDGVAYFLIFWSSSVNNEYDKLSLGEKQKKLLTILDSLPVAIFLRDNKGFYIECNKSFSYFLGKKREEIIGKNIFDIFSKEEAEKFYNNDLKIINEGGVDYYEAEIKTPQGVKKIYVYKSLIRGSNNEVIGIVGSYQDITNLKETENKLNQRLKELRQVNEVWEEKKNEISKLEKILGS